MTDSQAATVPTTPTGRPRALPILVVVAILLSVAGVVGVYLLIHRGDRLAKTDPVGARACRDFRTWIEEDRKAGHPSPPDVQLLGAMKLAEEAKGATTPGIRAAAGGNVMDDPAAAPVVANGGPSEFRAANLAQLHAACVAAGESMPAYAAGP